MSSSNSTSSVVPTSQWEACIRSISRTSANPAQPSTPNPHFDYVPLGIPAHDIRLFSLFPADVFEDEIAGGLIHASLDALPVYETVSYVWGNASICENIQLQYISSRAHPKYGKHEEPPKLVPVTTNLALLLRRLRYSVIPRLLWIDAICINQNDNDEKGHQVQLMATIYKFGSRSTVWLGEERDGSSQALRLIGDCVTMSPPAIESWQAALKGLSRDPSGFDENHSMGKVPKTHYLTRPECQYVSNLLDHRELWFRIWILQEIIFAPQPVLMCGPELLFWDTLAAFLNLFQSPDSLFKTKAVQHALLMDEQRKLLRRKDSANPRSGSLFSLLRFTESFRSSDERDRLYALLNITDNDLAIKPNYNISAREMWISAFKVHIRMENSLVVFKNPFHFVAAGELDSPTVVPSWARLASADDHLVPNSWLKITNYSGRLGRSVREKGHVLEYYDVPSEVLHELAVDSIWLGTVGDDSHDNFTFHDMLHIKQMMNVYSDFWIFCHLVLSALDGILQIPCNFSKIVEELLGGLSTHHSDPTRYNSVHILTADEALHIRQIYGTKIACRSNEGCSFLSCLDGEESETGFHEILVSLFAYRLNITSKGFILVLPPPIRQGDQFHIVLGSPVVLVLRPVYQTPGRYEIIGEGFAYLIAREDAVQSPEVSTFDSVDEVMKLFHGGINFGEPSQITLV